MGWVLWTKSIENPILLPSGNPGTSSGKTLGNPHAFVTL